MQIQCINSAIYGAENNGKHYCSETATGSDNHDVHRYLHPDGHWADTCHYFDTHEQINTALAKGYKPDFTLTQIDLDFRALIRQDIEEALNRELDY